MVTLLMSLELNHLLYPLITSNPQAALTTLTGLGVAGTLLPGGTVFYLPRHDGDPMNEPSLHLCLSVPAVWKKINIAVCC